MLQGRVSGCPPGVTCPCAVLFTAQPALPWEGGQTSRAPESAVDPLGPVQKSCGVPRVELRAEDTFKKEFK